MRLNPDLTPGQTLALIFGMPLILGVLYTGWLAILATACHYSWREMDWNADGHTTVREVLATADVLERPVKDQDRVCTELFWAKGGVRIRLECPAM
jgi:hypothetical protein